MNKLRIIFLSAAFFAAPFLNVKAAGQWLPDGTEVYGPDNSPLAAPLDVTMTTSAEFYGGLNNDAQYYTGYAVTGGIYTGGDVINSDGTGIAGASYDASIDADALLDIYGTLGGDTDPSTYQICPIKIDGSILISTGNDVNTAQSCTVNINTPVIFEPYMDGLAPSGYAPVGTTNPQIIFEAAAGYYINVNAYYDLIFRGMTVDPTSGDANGYTDLIITFSGSGQTIFNMYDGTTIRFDGQMDRSQQASIDPNSGLFTLEGDVTANAGGCKVFVTMDQTKAQVDAGQNKVLFQRANDTTLSLNTTVLVGPNSVFTYVSDNASGLDNTITYPVDGTQGKITLYDLGGYGVEKTINQGGYAAVGFDPTTTGTGRLVLFVRGAYQTGWQRDDVAATEDAAENNLPVASKYPFNDGAVVVAGHYVSGFTPEELSAPFDTATDPSIATGYNFSMASGVKAIMRIVDNNAYAGATTLPFNPKPADRRGLLVINECQSLGKYASDPYWDIYCDPSSLSYYWAYANNPTKNVRTGFVLGVNGVIDVYESAFLDYVGGAINSVDMLEYADNGNDASILKKKNPSALIVDGLDPSLTNTFIAAWPFEEYIGGFVPDDPSVVRAQILLRGNAQVLFKNAASWLDGYLINYWLPDSTWSSAPDVAYDAISNPSVDFNTALASGFLSAYGLPSKFAYDGYSLDYDDRVTIGEGEHTLCVEGALDINSIANNSLLEDPYYYTEPTYRNNVLAKNGMITMSSILTDHAGREINLIRSGGAYTIAPVSRPLEVDGNAEEDKYVRYNSPGLFLNNTISLFDTKYIHADATKYVTGLPSESEPAMTGGERYYFADGTGYYPSYDYAYNDPNRYRFPEFRLFNSELQLHETLNASGVRFVVMDKPISRIDTEANPYDFSSKLGSNKSIIRFFDHGTSRDADITGYGRLFMLGSEKNLMADDTANYITQSASLNVFKHNVPMLPETVTPSYADYKAALDNTATVSLMLLNGNEFPANTNPALYESNRSTHFVWMGIPASDVQNAQTGVFVGWSDVLPDVDNPNLNDDYPRPFDATTGDFVFPTAYALGYPYNTEPYLSDSDLYNAWYNGFLFKLDSNISTDLTMTATLPCPQAELVVGGDGIGFIGADNTGAGPAIPVKDVYSSGDIFVNYGGKLTLAEHPLDASITFTTIPTSFSTYFEPRNVTSYIVDSTPIATTIADATWNDMNYNGDKYVTHFSGEANLSKDPVLFGTGYGVQPYLITRESILSNPISEGYVRLPYEGEVDTVNIAWATRDLRKVVKKPTLVPMPRPTYLWYVGPGADARSTDIQQFNVSGATPSDPFYIDISGDGVRPISARIREFASLKSTGAQPVPCEGKHAILMGENGGCIGIGSTEWNENSVNAWNILGKDFVSLAPLGNCTINLNEDVVIADSLPFIGTELFGITGTERMTITSDVEREIRVKRGVIIDLRTFGQNPNGQQQIAFGGNVKVVFEEGAGIRFPSNVAGKGVVLYFNDNSQMVFDGISDAITAPYTTAAESKINRSRFLGKGQIWMNKSSQLNVMGTACVGVEADALTPNTDVTISLQRAAQFNIGNTNLAGGNFQVGNVTPITVNGNPATIAFTLAINGPTATFHIDRQGFFGLGAGFINGTASNPNGSAVATNNPQLTGTAATLDTTSGLPVWNPNGDYVNFVSPDPTKSFTAWQIVPLSNVTNLTLTVQNGVIEHYQIADGSTNYTNASLWAFGPFSGTATVNINGADSATILGGGNIMYVPTLANQSITLPSGTYAMKYYPVNIWDYAGKVLDGSYNNGTTTTAVTNEQYSILPSGPLMTTRGATIAATAPSVAVTAYNSGNSFTFTPQTTGAVTTQADLFSLMSFVPFGAQSGTPLVDVSSTSYGAFAGYTNYDYKAAKYPATMQKIVRAPNPNVGGGKATVAAQIGAARSANAGQFDPMLFQLLNVQ